MAHPVILPRQGQSVESCIITEWRKKVGDKVAEGDVLFSYETDKASFEETAKVAGTLLAVFFEADDDVPVLTTVALIGEPGEDVKGLGPDTPKKEEKAAPAAAPAVEEKRETAPAPAPKAESAAAGVSPRARATAARIGVDPGLAQPSGPYGRVIERDIFAAREGGAVSAPAAPIPESAPVQAAGGRAYSETKLSNIRKVIARTMFESISGMAQLTHNSSFDATRVLALREQFKAAPPDSGLNGVTLNDLVLFAVSRVLLRHPALNAHFLGDKIRLFEHVHLGMAVDTPRGLMVPTLFDADTLSLRQLSAKAKELSAAAVAGNISPDLLTEGSFTVSNLGALGIESFTPIINPPQAAILGVNCIMERVRSAKGGITVYPAMGLSLTYDHRAVDGAPASRFLKDLAEALQNIDILLFA